MKKQFIWLSVLVITLIPSVAVLAAEPVSSTATKKDAETEKLWRVTGSFTYESGDYGTNKTTNTVYIPVTIKRYLAQGFGYMTIPYVYQKSDASVSAIGGRAFRVNPGNSNSTRSSQGIGDIIMGGGFYLLDEEKDPINLTTIGKLKLPTADEDEGLGTGKFDETFGLEGSKTLDRWTLYADLGYTFIGEPDGLSLDNQFSFGFGTSYHLTDPTSIGIFYEESTALVDGQSNPRDLILNVIHNLDTDHQVFGDLSLGLSNGSPDAGLTVGANAQF